MPRITVNPTISFEPHFIQQFYLEDGVAIFSCVGDPEGIIAANKRSVALSDDGSIYYKTTDLVATGWVASGGGGAGTVTSVDLAMPSIFGVTGNPITTAGTITVALNAQNANLFFAGPATGVPAVPAFRAIVTADLSGVALAAAPANAIQYNNGTNGFDGSVNLLFDPATATIQAGVAAGITGKIQLRSSVSGSITHSVDNPAGNYIYIWPNALPATDDLLTVSVSGSTVTLSGVARSAVSGPTINATDGVLPYRSSATAFSDSQLVRTSSIITTLNAGQLLYPDGSASAPPIAFSNDDNTGFYRDNASSQIGFAFNGTAILALASSQLKLIQPVNFSTAFGSASDCGIARRQAGYIRITNASTGIGGLLVGGSTATPVGQTHLINGAVGVQPLFLEAIASTSVATIKAETSAVQSFAFNPSGKLQGGCNIPTSNQQFSAIGNLKSDVSSLGNVGTGQDNLLAFTVPANSIVNNGDTVEFKFTVVFAANANNKEVEATFGGVSVFLVSDAFSGSQAEISVRCKRTGATTAKIISTWVSSDTLLRADCQYDGAAAITWANANTFQVLGEATDTDDIVNVELESNVIIAQTS